MSAFVRYHTMVDDIDKYLIRLAFIRLYVLISYISILLLRLVGFLLLQRACELIKRKYLVQYYLFAYFSSTQILCKNVTIQFKHTTVELSLTCKRKYGSVRTRVAGSFKMHSSHPSLCIRQIKLLSASPECAL